MKDLEEIQERVVNMDSDLAKNILLCMLECVSIDSDVTVERSFIVSIKYLLGAIKEDNART